MQAIHFVVASNGIATLTVDRPAVKNALDWAAMRAFAQTVQRAALSPDLRALIITGAGDTFIAGGDMKDLANYPNRNDGVRLSTIMGKALERLRALPFPTIADINGPALGGGAEVAVACDIRVMARSATIGFVQARLGMVAGWGGARRLLPLVGYPMALQLLATARVLDASEAKEIGLIDHLVAPGQALQTAQKLAEQMAENPMEAVRAAKKLLRFAVTHPEVAKQAERRLFAKLWASDFRRQAVARFFNRTK